MLIVYVDWNSYLQLFLGYPLFIQIALIVIVISVILFLLANAGLALDRMKASYEASRLKNATSIVSDALIGNLIMEDKLAEKDFLPYVDRVNELAIKSKLFNQVVIDQIIYYHRNFTDSTERILKKLFSNLKLSEKVILKLKSGSWELQAKGLREMREMKPDHPVDEWIDPILNDKNGDLRIEAQSTYLKLHKNNPFGFLDIATEELLRWHQILLYEIVINTPDLVVPDLRALLKSKNVSVISFAIKLAAYYQQLAVIPTLILLLDHHDQQIRIDALEVLALLYAEEAEATMLKKFPTEELKVQLKIIESIGLIKSGRQLEFLKAQYLNSTEFTLIKTAGCALVIYPEFNIEAFLTDSVLRSVEQKKIISHCANTLIRN